MCLPRTNTNTSTPLTHISNNVMIKHRLMKAKMFASQVQSQSQAQQQLLSSTMKMIHNDTTDSDSDSDTEVSRCVRFNNDVTVVPFEKVTIPQENKETPNNIWYTTTEMKQIKKESREIASSYRKLGRGENDTDTDTEYRGFENCTAIRQKQKIMSNRCVVYAYEQGFDADEIATIYSKTNKWSSEVAFLQAIHDYMNVYDTNTNGNNGNSVETTTIALPSISSMIPPQPHPFAIESVMVMQRKKKRQRAAQAQAQQLFAFQQEQQPQERSVRQRVC